MDARQQFPLYIPPEELEQLYDDWTHDRSVAWLDVAPDEWLDYIDRLILFQRYVEFCEYHPDEANTPFDDWVEQGGFARHIAWAILNYSIGQKMH